jgi:putative peptidoglycan lipid II flippase
MMNNNNKAVNQLSSMVLVTIITQVFILIKNSLVAANFGVSAELDAFNFTNTTSSFIYSFIGAGIFTILIPYLREKNNKQSIDIFITVIYTIGFLLLILMLIFREQIVIGLSGINGSKFLSVASKIFIFTLFTGFLNSLIELASGVLAYNGQFNRQKLSVLFTTILLVTMLWLGTDVSIYYYATIVLITTILNVTIHLFFLKKSGFKYNLDYDINNTGFKEMGKLFLPVILSTGVYQISLLVDTMIAARLDIGSISILTYANGIISMINMLLLGNLTTYFYPKLVKHDTETSRQKSLTEYILFLNAILCLNVTLFFMVGEEGISILYERGSFTDENTNLVFMCALIYAISLPVNGIRDLIYKYFYIKKDTYSPLKNSIVISILNLTISLLLSNLIGLYGIVLGTVIASYLSLFLISLKFKKKFPITFNKKYFIIENSKVVIVTLLTILILITIKGQFTIENTFLGILVYSPLTLVFFVALLFIFKSKVFKIRL